MRRALWWVMLLGLGILLGFLVRLVFPRTKQSPVYDAPGSDSVEPAAVR
jgi:hypothetical protein